VESIFLDLKQALIDLNQSKAEDLANSVVTEGMDCFRAVEVCGDGLKEIGNQFESGAIFLPELMKSGQIMQRVLGILEPEMKKKGQAKEIIGRVVIGTVEGDVHDIGKNIVAIMFLLHGFEVHDIGKNVPVSQFVHEAKKVRADIVAASAMLTTTMIDQRNLVNALIEEGLKDRVKVLVGGAPVTSEWAKEIGADGYADNAVEGVKLAKKIIGRQES